MPNHIVNYVLCPDLPEERAHTILEPLTDFDLIVPPPPFIVALNDAENAAADPRIRGDILGDALDHWRREHWGTKWSSYRVQWVEGGVRFETAWRHPFPILRALAGQHPKVAFSVQYADEDIGYNLGQYRITYCSHLDDVVYDGELHEVFEEGTEDAKRFACHLWQRDYEAWKQEREGDWEE